MTLIDSDNIIEHNTNVSCILTENGHLSEIKICWCQLHNIFKNNDFNKIDVTLSSLPLEVYYDPKHDVVNKHLRRFTNHVLKGPIVLYSSSCDLNKEQIYQLITSHRSNSNANQYSMPNNSMPNNSMPFGNSSFTNSMPFGNSSFTNSMPNSMPFGNSMPNSMPFGNSMPNSMPFGNSSFTNSMPNSMPFGGGSFNNPKFNSSDPNTMSYSNFNFNINN